MFDVTKVRQDFPILSVKIYNKPLVYLDNAASSQKPNAVIQAISNYYSNCHSNIHRAFHYLGDNATLMYEQARSKVTNYINATGADEIIFTRGTTESINLVASILEHANFFRKSDEIILTVAEHHSNIVPWQLLAERTGAVIKVVNLLPNGELDLSNLDNLLSANPNKIKLLAINHISNGLGIINPIKLIVKKTKSINPNILVLVDGAQAMPSLKIDVRDLGCDFYAFSGHKMYAPTGIGVLYGKAELLRTLPPYHGGGEMIDQVILPMGTTYANIPHRYEAGTPNIAGAIGLGAAIDYLNQFNFNDIVDYKNKLLHYCEQKLLDIPGLNILANSQNKTSLIAFSINNINPQDIGLLLDQYGIAVRAGHHCNMPLMNYLGLPGSVRVSFGIYNTLEEIDIFIDSLQKILKILEK